MVYAKIEKNKKLKYFTNPLILDGLKIFNPSKEQLSQCGYYQVDIVLGSEEKIEQLDDKIIITRIKSENNTETYQQEFKYACDKFKACCYKIRETSGIDQFFGGYDEIDQVKSIEFYDKNNLLLELLFLNQLCLHTAKKIGLAAPAWFYQCWGIE